MIVLYNPPSSAGKKPVLPMSLLALGALLEGKRDYRIIDGNLETDPRGAIEEALPRGAGVLAVTVMPGPQLSDATPLCRDLKARHPSLTVVWGGYFPTQHYEAVLASGFVDWVVRGHGEIVFESLLSKLDRGEDPRGLPGLAWREADGTVKASSLAEIPHPDALPDFPYRRVDMPRYARATFMGKRTFSHHSSYGCPFLCNFCAVVNMVGGSWQAQSAARTASVVESLVRERGADSVEFFDNNFFVHEARTAEFCERIRPLDIGWWGEARIDTLLKHSGRTWRLMRESGLRMVYLGAESGSEETLRRMNKGGAASVEKTLEIAAKMAGLGIIPEMSFVLGCPPDPEEDIRQGIALIRRLKRANPAAEVVLYLYTPVPLSGTLYDQAKADGFRFPKTLEEWTAPEWSEFSQRRSLQVPWLKDPQRRRIRDFEKVLNAYYPTVTDRGLGKASRALLRAAGAWRYHAGVYRFPLELRALQKLLAYQRPETSGL